METDFGLGTFGSRLWGGQTVPLQVLYRRREAGELAPITEHLAGIRSLYTRMLVSEKIDSMEVRSASVEQEVALDDGAAFSVQHNGAVLLGYVPLCRRGTTMRTIRTSVVFPFHHSRPDEVRLGDEVIAGFSASNEGLDWCFIRDGDVYIAIHPLIARQQDVMLCSTQFADAEQYGLLSFYNMCGFAQCELTNTEIRSFGSGLVLEVGTADQYNSFSAFMDAMRQSVIFQDQYGSERTLRYARRGTELELLYDFQQLNLRRAVANGMLVSESAWLETDPDLPLVR